MHSVNRVVAHACALADCRDQTFGHISGGGGRSNHVGTTNQRLKADYKEGEQTNCDNCCVFFYLPKYQLGSAEIQQGPPVLLMRVGQSHKHSPPFPFFIFNETPFHGLSGEIASSILAHVHNLLYFPVFSSSGRPSSCNCKCTQRVIWCRAAGERLYICQALDKIHSYPAKIVYPLHLSEQHS